MCVCVCVWGEGGVGRRTVISKFETSNSTSQNFIVSVVSQTHPYVLSQCILVSLSIRCSTVAVTNVLFYSLTMSYLYRPTILLY